MPADRYKILISAYACEPGKGSEPGVGWNVALCMAKLHDVWVLTRANNRSRIEAALQSHPVPGMNFLYYDLPGWCSWWKRGPRGVLLYYFIWQLLARRAVRGIEFDCIHHLTFNQYRTISFGYFLPYPFLIGPVGGGECVPKTLRRDLNCLTRIKETLRGVPWDRPILNLLLRHKKNVMFLFSNRETRRRVGGRFQNTSTVLPAVGLNPAEFDYRERRKVCPTVFSMAYAGRALDWKGIKLLLKAMALVKHEAETREQSWRLDLIGVSNTREQERVNSWISTHGLESCVRVIPFLERDELLDSLAHYNVSVYPAFRDSGSMSVLESCAMACPVICLDIAGQEMLPENVVLKVKVAPDYDETCLALAEKMLWAMKNPRALAEVGHKARTFVLREFDWSYKAQQLNKQYQQLVE